VSFCFCLVVAVDVIVKLLSPLFQYNFSFIELVQVYFAAAQYFTQFNIS
jgi:hypothetical protein